MSGAPCRMPGETSTCVHQSAAFLTSRPYLEVTCAPQSIGSTSSPRAARDGGPLRGEGQPRPRLLPSWRRSAPLRRGQPGRGARGARCRWAGGATLVCSNPVKRRDHIVEAAALGVRLFVVDSMRGGPQGRRAAPGTAVLCRLVTSGEGSDWPLSRKYGCSTSEAVEVLSRASYLGLEAAGVSFHVGSQHRDPEAGAARSRRGRACSSCCARRGLRPRLLDMGGGLPGVYDDGCPPSGRTARPSQRHLDRSFGDSSSADDRRARPRHRRGRGGLWCRRSSESIDRARRALGVPRRRCLHRPGGDARRGHPLPAHHHARRPQRAVRAGRARPATAPTCSTRRRWCHCRCPAGATRSGCCPPAPTPAALSVGFIGFAPLPTVLSAT